MGTKVARGGARRWLGLESEVRGVDPWGWVGGRMARGWLMKAVK